jgi:hypothetical protein
MEEPIIYPCMSEPAMPTFRTSMRGAPILIDPMKFEYSRNKAHERVTNWNCLKKRTEGCTLGCMGTVVTDNQTGMIVRWSPHKHDPDPIEVKVKLQEERVLESASKQPRLSTGAIIAEWQKSTLDEAEKTYLPSKRTMQRKVRRLKKAANHHPALPKDYTDLVDLPEHFKRTSDGGFFLIDNAEVNDQGERMLVFASNAGLKMLQKSKSWSADGTFDVVPSPFCQLYSVMSELDGYSYPCLFSLLPNKRGATYRALMETIYQKVTEKGDLNLRQLVIDFEGPVVKEFKTIFGNQIRVTGCLVHFSRSLRRKQGQIGELLSWQSHADFKIFTNCLKGLAFVPPNLVSEYFKQLIDQELPKLLQNLDENRDIKAEKADEMKQALNKYLDYFEKSYIGRQGKTCWLKGKYPIQIWSQHENVLEGRQLSTNRHEGWHSRLRKSLVASATLWALLDELRDVEASTRHEREEDIERGPAEEQTGNSRKQKEKRLARQQKLRRLVMHMDDYDMVSYLKRVSSYKGYN